MRRPSNLDEMKRVAKISRPVTSKLCFVVMPFNNPVLDTYYAEAVASAVERSGLRCVRVDQDHFDGKITDQIQRSIDDAAVVIVDTTGDNPNCYFEAGYAVAKKKLIIWQRLNAPMFTSSQLRFDVQDYPHILYTTAENLRERLHAKLEAHFGSRALGSPS
jgi:hypothetical protein